MLLKIIFVNLILSIDNVSIIALQTSNLSEKDAILVRQTGIILSFLIKIFLLCIINILLNISWLHFHFISGILLLYISFNTLRELNNKDNRHNENTRKKLLSIIITYAVVDISMSLDNILSILAVVSSNNELVGINKIALIIIGLLVCIPVLLWFSSKITNLMQKLRIIPYICISYLVYLALNMIFSDSTISMILKKINFNLYTIVSITISTLVIIYGLFKIYKHKS